MDKKAIRTHTNRTFFLCLMMVWGFISCQNVEEVIPNKNIEQEYLMDTRVARTEVGCPANLPAPWPGAQMGRDYGCYRVEGTKGQQLMANKARLFREAQAIGTDAFGLLAEAMLETENMGTDYAFGDTYYRNGQPVLGSGKSGDAANFGACKWNVYELRITIDAYRFIRGVGDSDMNPMIANYEGCSRGGQLTTVDGRVWNLPTRRGIDDRSCWRFVANNPVRYDGRGLNNSPRLEAEVYRKTKRILGDRFFFIHRWGESGNIQNGLSPLDNDPFWGRQVWNVINSRNEAYWRVDVARFSRAFEWTREQLERNQNQHDALRYWVNIGGI